MEMGWSESSSESDMDFDVLETDMQEVSYSKARKGPLVAQN